MRLAQFDQAADTDDTPTRSSVAGRRKSTAFADDPHLHHDRNQHQQLAVDDAIRSARHRQVRRGSRLDMILNRCDYAPTSNDELRRMSIVNRYGRAVSERFGPFDELYRYYSY